MDEDNPWRAKERAEAAEAYWRQRLKTIAHQEHEARHALGRAMREWDQAETQICILQGEGPRG